MNVIIDVVDGQLRAKRIPESRGKPDYTYVFDGVHANVWVNFTGIEEGEIEDLAWLTVKASNR